MCLLLSATGGRQSATTGRGFLIGRGTGILGFMRPRTKALLWTLATALKEEWTDDVAQAWTTAYTIVAETAIAGAREAMPDPQPL